MSGALVWLRDDLRLHDNPALHAAVTAGGPVTVAYVLDDQSEGLRPFGGAARWWLHGSLAALDADLRARGNRLVLRRGAAATVIDELVRDTRADTILWNRRYGAAERAIDTGIKQSLTDRGHVVHSAAAALLWEPWTLATGQGQPYRVFSPFWRAAQAMPTPREPLPRPVTVPAGPSVASDALDDWGLLPTRPDWAGGLRATWTPGEAGAAARFRHFLEHGLEDYDQRDQPSADAASGLSPHIRWGEISPYQLWHRLHGELTPAQRRQAPSFLRQLAWREFNWHELYHEPDMATVNVRPEFDAFPWRSASSDELDRWRYGRTGIDLVDAGMRELWHTGAMHNRVRLVVGSFLVKNLLVDWRVGEQWFWDTLVDADSANNAGNWQWVAGSGFDAAPFFRVFNPQLQADKFDPHRSYIRQWIPADEVRPEPMVDLKSSRARALDAYQQMRAV
ncbi:deoxyribodipyrimidine photo-lyase [Curtobacterium sp. MCBD17_034]|uniref:cryptochrome/photolyase family protein n=1 Tax=unclassified Curtobacterium TaxID=257496 RepID=UPI000DA8C8D4|nr:MULTISPECIES: deoxyribodipyrimidine photo-lyase [unclassified Curtobacterium]PZF58644.1 deoxyribodipyrimidine photo-lyase [Curtobacterium sp. MCBD17_034]PZF64306.1 deoxyribodipyrimidine photo-lyase [Curtobacterium sp. MCBD17_013]PZM34634.1 deoxyribodipyrimidine photo-lyase [Curtobacterium sp. MCBD17_031]